MGRNSPKLDVVVGLTQCSRIASWWWCCRSSSWCLASVLVLQWRGPGSTSVAVPGVVHVLLAFLDGEKGVVSAVEEGASLLVVVVRDSIRGVGVSSCIELGLGSWLWCSKQISGVPARMERRVCPLVILALRPCLLFWLLWLSMSNPWVPKDSGVAVAIMQVRCFFRPGISSIAGAFLMGGHPFRCHSLWSSLVYRCHCNLNQIILNNIEAKVRFR